MPWFCALGASERGGKNMQKQLVPDIEVAPSPEGFLRSIAGRRWPVAPGTPPDDEAIRSFIDAEVARSLL